MKDFAIEIMCITFAVVIGGIMLSRCATEERRLQPLRARCVEDCHPCTVKQAWPTCYCDMGTCQPF